VAGIWIRQIYAARMGVTPVEMCWKGQKWGVCAVRVPEGGHYSMTVAARITISEETLALLRKMGCGGESDDEIIWRLIRERPLVSLDGRWNQILEEDEFLPLEEL